MTLLVCKTCPRYDVRRNGEFARGLIAAITAEARRPAVRGVQCLGGCPGDGVVALDGPGMTRVRFNHLTADDAPAVVEAACAHAASVTGHPEDWTVPSSIAGRISAVTTKRGPGPDWATGRAS